MSINMQDTRVSIGLPVYNGERYLEETIESVLGQTYGDFVLFISDNASTDQTSEICQDYASKDARIHYSRNETNIGAAGNYERCYAPARSEFFRWQNADDLIHPTLIERCLEALESNPDAALAYCQSDFIDEHGAFMRAIEEELDVNQETAFERFLHCVSHLEWQHHMYGLIRRDVLENTARMQPYLGSDMNFVAELSMYGKFIKIPETLFFLRMHPGCYTWNLGNEEKQTDFWNPGGEQMRMQKWRSFFEFYKAAKRAPITWRDRQKIFSWLLRSMNWNRKVLLSEGLNLFRSFFLRNS